MSACEGGAIASRLPLRSCFQQCQRFGQNFRLPSLCLHCLEIAFLPSFTVVDQSLVILLELPVTLSGYNDFPYEEARGCGSPGTDPGQLQQVE